jgi:hypothetical protein
LSMSAHEALLRATPSAPDIHREVKATEGASTHRSMGARNGPFTKEW